MIRKSLLVSILLLGVAPFMVGAQATPAPTTVDIPTTPAITDIGSLSLGIPGTHDVKKEGLPALVANIYDLALMLAGFLAFASIVYGGIMYLSQPGNHEAQSQAKERIRDAILGLLLLIGLYMVMNIINPDLTNLRFPSLQRLQPPESLLGAPNPNSDPIDTTKPVYACVPDSYLNPLTKIPADDPYVSKCSNTEATVDAICNVAWDPRSWGNLVRYVKELDKDQAGRICAATNPTTEAGQCKTNCSCTQHKASHPGANSCSESPAVQSVVACINKSTQVTLTTTSGNHAGNSCHFGGRTCTDGGHAIDVGINGSRAAGLTLAQSKFIVEQCGTTTNQPVRCRYEDANGTAQVPGDPSVNHIHCNVATASCGCN
jgi:hypothetical protein